ncbi:HNH endonuclease [Bacillus subtilis]|uniref:HNH endonuclease n=1 Tax=Bacillus subtilis TaxID=1423 RepID=A0AC61YY46_BACIU
MERKKTCSICGEHISIANFSKKDKKRWRSYCKNCGTLRNEMMKAKMVEIPKLDQSVEIEVRGKLANGHGYTYFVHYEKAMQMVNEKVAYIVHEKLIKKYFDRDTFRKLIFKRYGEKCFYCGGFADTIDHIIPKSQGGLSSFSNCVPACINCNEAKDSMLLDEYLFYFDPYTVIPDTSKTEHVRIDLMQLAERLDNINTYLNMCLKKVEDNGEIYGFQFEMIELNEKMKRIIETVSQFKEAQNQESLL